MRHTRGPLKWSFIQIYINKTYYTYDASWVRTTLATVIKSILVKILLFSSFGKSFSAVVTAGKRFPDLYPDFSGLLVVTHLPSTQIYKFLSFFKIFGIFQLLKFPPKRLFVPDCRTAAAIRFRLSSTLPSRDNFLVSREPVPGLHPTPPSNPTGQDIAWVVELSLCPLTSCPLRLPRMTLLEELDELRLLRDSEAPEVRWRANNWARASPRASVSSKRSSHSRRTVSCKKTTYDSKKYVSFNKKHFSLSQIWSTLLNRKI